jgi:hypothetical protein
VQPDVKHSAKNYRENRTNASLTVQIENDDPEYKHIFTWVEEVDGKWEKHEKLSVVASCSYRFPSEKVYPPPEFHLYATEKNNKGSAVSDSFRVDIRRTTQ